MEDKECYLTPREKDIVQELVYGRNNNEIAAKLFISKSTVKTHLEHIFYRFGVSNRIQLAVLATRKNLVTVENEKLGIRT